jgi:DNA replication initiation complex subunit (GINS family)
MQEEKINYRILRKIQETEKNSPILTELVPDFYGDLTEYLENLNNRLEKETAHQKQMLLNDEIQNTKKIAASIYEQREKKILLAAISKARGGNPDLKNMIDAETNLYESVLNVMLTSRKKYLEKETKKESEDATKTIETEEKREDEIVEQPEIKEPAKTKETKQKNTNPIIRITKDIPEFIGTDEKKYNLKNNDVLSLPEDMGEMLSKRGAAEKINK